MNSSNLKKSGPSGATHITLACTNLPKSIAFYRNVLGGTLHAERTTGADISLGDLWVCLKGVHTLPNPSDARHITLTCPPSAFAFTAEHIAQTASSWETDTSQSATLHFRDPDGHKLELRAGSLQPGPGTSPQTKTHGMRLVH